MVSDFERNLGDITRRLENNEVVLTKFLDLSEMELAKSLNSKYEVNFFGGYENAERNRACINVKNPHYSSFNITAYQIIYNENLNISHRNILGTLMSLGIKRNLIGDIIVTKDGCFFLCCNEMSKYIETEFTKINNQKIVLKKVSYQKLDNINNQNKEEKTVIVPSLRLDIVTANGFNISRSKVVLEISKQELFINNKVVTKPDYEVKLNEVISFRGHGRLKLIEIGKLTRKNNLVIRLEVYK